MKLYRFLELILFFVLLFVGGLLGMAKMHLEPIWFVIYIFAFPNLMFYCLYLINKYLKKRNKTLERSKHNDRKR